MSNNVTQRMECTGLRTAPNPMTKRPKGSMVVADEVVCRRDGMLEPRPGFMVLGGPEVTFGDGGGETPYTNVEGLIPFGPDCVVQTQGRLYSNRYDDPWQRDDDAGVAEDFDCLTDAVRGLRRGDTLYCCAEDGVRKLLQLPVSAYSAETGAPIPFDIDADVASGDVEWLADDETVAYRAVLVLEDLEGRVVMSAPSGRRQLKNLSGVDKAVSLTVYLPKLPELHPFKSRRIALYRSKSTSGATASDEMFLAHEHEITTAEVTARELDIEDERLPEDLGRQLYTNPSRQTIARGNARPPMAHDLALYAGSVFAARPTYPFQYTLTYSAAEVPANVLVSSADYVNGQQTLQNVTFGGGGSWADVRVGMVVDSVAGMFADIAWVIWFDAGLGMIQVSQECTATGSGTESFTLRHAVHMTEVGGAREIFLADESPSLFARLMATGVAALVTTDLPPSELFDAFHVGSSVVVRRRWPSDPVFYVTASWGEAYSPPLELPDPDDDEAGTAAEQPPTQHAVAWSKNEEPEHFLEGGYLGIGNEQTPVLRIFAVLDGLWIFKGQGDGIYRLTGFGERSGWRVQQMSATAYLLHPNLACALGETIYAWTNEGAVEISAGGMRHISKGVIGLDTAFTEHVLTHAYEKPGTWCIGNAKDAEVLWGLPASGLPDDWAGAAFSCLCFNARTRAWSNWFASGPYEQAITAAAIVDQAPYDGFGDVNPAGAIVLALFGENTLLRIERPLGDGFITLNADEDWDVTVSAVVDNGDGTAEVTIAAGSGTSTARDDWQPAVGDVLNRGGGACFVVTAVTSATVFDVAGLPTTGSGSGFVGFEAVLRWQPEFGAGPAATKRFAATAAHFDALGGARIVTMRAETPPGAAVEQDYLRDYSHDFDPEVPADVRMLLPPAAAMGQRLNAGLAIRQADARFRVSGLSIEYRDTGRAVSR